MPQPTDFQTQTCTEVTDSAIVSTITGDGQQVFIPLPGSFSTISTVQHLRGDMPPEINKVVSIDSGVIDRAIYAYSSSIMSRINKIGWGDQIHTTGAVAGGGTVFLIQPDSDSDVSVISALESGAGGFA